MAITRTPWIDDDGSGTTGTIINNAEKTLLYNQIDAALASLPQSYLTGSWTPVDASGAGLVLTGAGGRYIRIGNLVMIQANITWPANGSGAVAVVGGLPFSCHNTIWGGLYHTYGVQSLWYINPGATTCVLYSPTALVGRTNADMSGAQVGCAGVYYTL